jgi:zinc protease
MFGDMRQRLRRQCRSVGVATLLAVASGHAEPQASSVVAFDDVGDASNAPRKSVTARPFELAPAHAFRLENGLRVVVQRDARQPLIAFVVSYEVGHRDDPPGYEGLAHLVEHLSFRGSRHLAPYQALYELERVGALEKNGATGPDNTVYYCTLPAQYLELAFWIESERMGFTLERFSRESLALEQATVRKEMLLRRQDEVDLAFWSLVFPKGHPYRRTELADARAAGLSDVRWFFQAGYRPDKANIVVVGDVDPALVESLARRYFGPIPNPPTKLARKPIARREFPGRERLSISRLFRGPRLVMLWPAPLPGSADDVALQVAVRIAGMGRTSIGATLHKKKLADGAALDLERWDGAAFFSVEAKFGGRAAFEATEYAIETYLYDLGRQPRTREVLERARADLKHDLLRDTEDPLEHAWLHLDALRHGGRPFDLSKTLGKVHALTAADIMQFAKKYWSPYHRLSMWHGDLRFEPTVQNGDEIQYEVFE